MKLCLLAHSFARCPPPLPPPPLLTLRPRFLSLSSSRLAPFLLLFCPSVCPPPASSCLTIYYSGLKEWNEAKEESPRQIKERCHYLADPSHHAHQHQVHHFRWLSSCVTRALSSEASLPPKSRCLNFHFANQIVDTVCVILALAIVAKPQDVVTMLLVDLTSIAHTIEKRPQGQTSTKRNKMLLMNKHQRALKKHNLNHVVATTTFGVCSVREWAEIYLPAL